MPAKLHTLGGGREVGAPWVTRSKLVRPNVRNQPTLAVTRTRGVEDAAPYGQVRDVGCGIVVNKCAIAANLLPPLGSPERGAVAARSGVTEGLVQGRVRCSHAIRQPRPGGRGSPPLRGVGRWVRGTSGVGHPANGAPRTVRPTTYWERFRIVITPSVIRRKGRRGRRPLRGVR